MKPQCEQKPGMGQNCQKLYPPKLDGSKHGNPESDLFTGFFLVFDFDPVPCTAVGIGRCSVYPRLHAHQGQSPPRQFLAPQCLCEHASAKCRCQWINMDQQYLHLHRLHRLHPSAIAKSCCKLPETYST